MSLRRKLLLSFVLLTLMNGVVALLVLEAAHLAGKAPEADLSSDELVAPGLAAVGSTLLLGTIFVSYLLFWNIRRQILDPLDEIIAAAGQLGSGEPTLIRTIKRQDEIGQLAAAFNSMAENISEAHSHLEEKVEAATAKIAETQRELAFAERLAATGRLAAGVAHEINHPLGGIMNAIARLRKDNLAPERRTEYLDLCDEGLKRIQGTVRRILDFSRKRPEIGPVLLTLPLRQSVDMIRHRLAASRIELRYLVDESPEAAAILRVLADSGDLQHVFLNLLMNAIDAMPDGGTLRVSAANQAGQAWVEIADTGVGLTPEEISASFDYFHTTKPVGKGTGLGLSIAHHIVAGYQGSLSLESVKGQGTTARVVLPSLPPIP